MMIAVFQLEGKISGKGENEMVMPTLKYIRLAGKTAGYLHIVLFNTMFQNAFFLQDKTSNSKIKRMASD